MSPRWVLDKQDFKKIGVGALVAVVGALLTYVSQVMTGVDFGEWTPVIVAVWSVIANIGRKWVTDHS